MSAAVARVLRTSMARDIAAAMEGAGRWEEVHAGRLMVTRGPAPLWDFVHVYVDMKWCLRTTQVELAGMLVSSSEHASGDVRARWVSEALDQALAERSEVAVWVLVPPL